MSVTPKYAMKASCSTSMRQASLLRQCTEKAPLRLERFEAPKNYRYEQLLR